MTTMLTVGSLFSGIGGLDLGLERAGMQVRFQVEIDPWCQKVLAKHWPDVPRYGDLRTVRGDELESVDLICGGFPCQPVSQAGKRRAQGDERWLWPEFARLLRILRPRYVLVENVSGLLARGFGDVLGDLAGLGFDAEWESLPAAAFGAPHIRDRVFLLAYPGRGRYGNENTPLCSGRNSIKPGYTNMAHATSSKRQASAFREPPRSCDWWAVEPPVDRVADGVPRRVDRLRGLGNAVVPQIAEWIGRQIIAFDKEPTP